MKPFKLYCILFLFTLFNISCNKNSTDTDDNSSASIIILYTNDEHGWMEPTDDTGGAAGLMGLWKENEGYTEDGPFLILSGGDMWTGPAISTLFEGESMAEVMNAMGYHAAAIGNHEFDFKIEGLQARIDQSNFPFLSANIRQKDAGTYADIAVPYIIEEVNNVNVGIIGLTTTSTPSITFPEYVEDYDFIPYDEALNDVVPQIWEEGAELLIVIGHMGFSEVQSLVPTALDLGISVIGGGHSHELRNEIINGVACVEGGSEMKFYAKVEILFDTNSGTISQMKTSTHPNSGGTPDPEIEAIVSDWKSQMDAELSEVIGYANNDIYKKSNEMYNMVTDSWLIAFPAADVSMTNTGGIRQTIPAGDIPISTIWGVLPFENLLVQLDLSGSELISCLDNFVLGGMTTIDGYRLADGTEIHSDSIYQVLTTDFLYYGQDNLFQTYDPDPIFTSMNYRQPVIDWIKSLNTSAADPLENYLDSSPRR